VSKFVAVSYCVPPYCTVSPSFSILGGTLSSAFVLSVPAGRFQFLGHNGDSLAVEINLMFTISSFISRIMNIRPPPNFSMTYTVLLFLMFLFVILSFHLKPGGERDRSPRLSNQKPRSRQFPSNPWFQQSSPFFFSCECLVPFLSATTFLSFRLSPVLLTRASAPSYTPLST